MHQLPYQLPPLPPGPPNVANYIHTDLGFIFSALRTGISGPPQLPPYPPNTIEGRHLHTDLNYIYLAITAYGEGILSYRGVWDASGNVFPSTGGSGRDGSIKKGNIWNISVAGVLGGVTVNIGYSIRALVDNPGTSLANWLILDPAIGFVPENTANKGIANGYASLDSSGKVPFAQLPALTSSEITTALGFTPYNATNPAGYISSITSSMVTTALGFTPYNATNPAGYISGITSGMVTGALGFTPYNATNPAGYVTANQNTTGYAAGIAGGAAGKIPYQSAANTTLFSAAGTAGQAMISGGTGSPTWYAPTATQMIYAGTGGILASDSSLTYANSSVGMITTNPYTNSFAGTSTVGAILISGSPYASSASAPPQFLMQNTTASTTWSSAGTYFGINHPSAFKGDSLNFKSAGTTYFNISATGNNSTNGIVNIITPTTFYYGLSVTGTGPLASSGTNVGFGIYESFTITGSAAGSAEMNQIALIGYTGNGGIKNISIYTDTASTTSNWGIWSRTYGTTIGTNIAVYGLSENGLTGIGVQGQAIVNKASGINIGVLGLGLNGSGSLVAQVGGLFALAATYTATTSAALIADNVAQSSPIALFMANGVEKVRIDVNGTINLASGSTTVPPLLFRVGSITTSPIAYAMETDGTHLYWTDSAGTRHIIV